MSTIATLREEQGNFTHIVLLLDASSSMEYSNLTEPVIQVVDSLIEKWTKQSLQLGDMTRLTVYQFSSENYLPNGQAFQCIWYDTDIQRLSTIKGRYTPKGNTALIDATLTAYEELSLIPTLHGDHTFLFFVITDGEENRSRRPAVELRRVIQNVPENWTMAAMVPHAMGRADALKYGFPAGNIQIWDATSARGVEEAGEVIAQATSNYMQSRTKLGMRSTSTLFVGGQVDAAAVKAKLIPLAHTAYDIVPVTKSALAFEKRKKPTKRFPEGESLGFFIRIDDFINKITNNRFEIGKGWYQLFSAGARTREKIGGNKQIAVMDKKTSQIYVGPEARDIVGLAQGDCTVEPGTNPDYEIFVKSTSENRHLPVGTKLLIMK